MTDIFPLFETLQPSPYAQTTVVATSQGHPLIQPMRAAFEDAMAMRGRLREDAFRIEGFSGRKFRLFMNNLIHEVPAARYLEIGLYHGASFCPALFKNDVIALGIDNWTEFGGNRTVFDRNLAVYKFEHTDVTIVEQDFRQVDYTRFGAFNIMFYDGSHAERDQYDGVYLTRLAMDEKYILIVDDWNWAHVRNGTYQALRDANIRIDYQIELRTSFGGEELPVVHGRKSEWHNGCFIAAVSKT